MCRSISARRQLSDSHYLLCRVKFGMKTNLVVRLFSDSELLSKISVALKFDFFSHYHLPALVAKEDAAGYHSLIKNLPAKFSELEKEVQQLKNLLSEKEKEITILQKKMIALLERKK